MILGMGIPELLIILVVVLLIFGPKNLPKIGSALGKTVKNVREGMEDGDKDKDKDKDKNESEDASAEEVVADEDDADLPDNADEGKYVYCNKCGTKNPADSAFCSKCGAKLSGGDE